jgi:nucleotide-binding universal stress UspA family protein
MAIKDIFLPLVGEPDVATIAAIDKCVAVASDLGAKVSAVAVEENISVRPKVVISGDLDNTTAIESLRSVSDAHGLLKAFDNAAIRFGVRNEQTLLRFAAADIPGNFATCARIRDLSLVLVKADDSRSEKIIERLIFESGRPILMCPEESAADLSVAFDDVVIAWDHTAPAARAVADALPILQPAAKVRIITATDDRTQAELVSGAALVSHLAEHGIKATFETVKIDGSSVGKVFEAYMKANAINLLVMAPIATPG